MMEYNDLMADLMRRVDTAEKELAELRFVVRGDQPPNHDGLSINDQLAGVERSLVVAAESARAQGNPIVVSDGEHQDDASELPVVEIEWGKVTAAPDSTPTATIELHPCDKDGTEYASAAHVTVYIRNDRSLVDLSEREWTTANILSFIRFPWDVGSAPAVAGVLVGEGLTPATGGEYCSSSACGLWYYFDEGRRCIGWGEWDGYAWNWTSPWGMPEPAAVPIPAWGGGVWS